MIIQQSTEDDRWLLLSDIIDSSYHVEILCSVLKITNKNINHENLEISLLFSDSTRVQKYNRLYRNKDYPTNALSFPIMSIEEIQDCNNSCLIGDIIFAYDVILEESIKYGIAFKEHFIHLLIHGFLHLLGYDHETIEETKEMEYIETASMQYLGFNNPYEN